MAKISFLQAPTFTADVEIPRFGGNPVKVKIIYNYLDRDEHSALADADIAYSKEMQELTKEEGSKVVELAARSKEHQFDQLKKVVNGWGFTEEFNDENLQALVGHSAETAAAIIGAFRNAYEKAREGNLKA